MGWDTIANMAVFLTAKTGSCFGTWSGRLSAEEQRVLFGKYQFGKKLITISGENEQVETFHKVAFGMDYEINRYTWREVAGIKYPCN